MRTRAAKSSISSTFSKPIFSTSTHPRPRTKRAEASRFSYLRLIAACLTGVLGLFLIDALLFRTNIYPSVLEPDSSTGLFQQILRRDRMGSMMQLTDVSVDLTASFTEAT